MRARERERGRAREREKAVSSGEVNWPPAGQGHLLQSMAPRAPFVVVPVGQAMQFAPPSAGLWNSARHGVHSELPARIS